MLSFLFQNKNVVVVDKPGGWLSVPSRLGAQDARPCLGRWLESELGQRIWPVHRLDEEVTGVMLFALTPEAHRDLSQAFETRVVHKTYEALTDLLPQAGMGVEPHSPLVPGVELRWECQLLRGKKRAYIAPHGKPSITLARLLEHPVPLEDGPALSWELFPLTGRGHQLRFELYRHGFPIIGDQLYGSRRAFRSSEIALRCVRLGFEAMPEVAQRLGLPSELRVPSLAP